MRVSLVTVGYNLPGSTKKLVDSALKECRNELTFLIFLHSGMPEKVAELEELAERSDVVYRGYGFNRGLAKSWNEGILLAYERGCDVAIVVNEDVRFAAGDVDRIAELAVADRRYFIVTGRAWHDSSSYHGRDGAWNSSEYACFAINPIAMETLGCFDENLFPVFYEDADYRRRAQLAGLTAGYCPTTTIRHEGSRSLSQPEVAQQNQTTWTKNREYFNRKWGGDPGQETFSHPFNDPRFSYFIDPRLREAPYFGLNRTDQHIVKV